MKHRTNLPFTVTLTRRLLISAGLAVLGSTAFGQTTLLRPVQMVVPPVVGRSTRVGPISPATVMYVNVSFKLPNPAALKAFNDSVSNPKSPTYRHFITPTQFGQQFGQPASVVNAAMNYLKSKGLTITLAAKNNLNIMATGTAQQVQAAFGTRIDDYHAISPKEPGRLNYYSYSTPVEFPMNLAAYVLNVSGLENFTMPKPRTTLTPDLTHVLYDTIPMYSAGETGTGRTVAISNWDGFSLSNVPLFYAQYNLPTPAGGVGSNITVVTIDGGMQNGPAEGEGDLDIQMVLGQAPLCTLIDYDGNDGVSGGLTDVLTREADDNLADILSESYGWALSPSGAEAANQIRQQMTAQGQTYMFAAGDNGTDLEPYSYPNYDPEVLSVGGSAASTDANGNRLNEVAWNGGGGGWTTDNVPFNVLPSWQVAAGCPTNINYRLNPDVALQASGNQVGSEGAFFFFTGGSIQTGLGTSFASPAWAGGLAVTEEWLIDNGNWTGNSQGAGLNRFGRIADLLYSQNMEADAWYDITVGDTGPLPDGSEATGHAGWDFCSGLGAIDYYGFANTQVSTGGGGGGGGTLGSGTASIYSDQSNGTLGQNPSGSNTNLTGDNGLSFNVQSVSSVYGPAVGVQVVWNLPDGTVNSLNATLGASAAQGATLFVYALDVNNQFDLVATQPLTATASVFTIKNLAKYAVNGTLTLVTRAIIPSRFNVSQFTLDVSQATLSGSITGGSAGTTTTGSTGTTHRPSVNTKVHN